MTLQPSALAWLLDILLCDEQLKFIIVCHELAMKYPRTFGYTAYMPGAYCTLLCTPHFNFIVTAHETHLLTCSILCAWLGVIMNALSYMVRSARKAAAKSA